MRRRQRGQSIVEFGIIALVFTFILFAIADFGLLLNDWLAVSSGTRQLARDAAVGAFSCTPSQCPTPDLWNDATAVPIPGVGPDPHFGGVYCCGPTAALRLNVVYYDECTPGIGGCKSIENTLGVGFLDNRYSSNGQQGTCGIPCTKLFPHPAPPAAPNPPAGQPQNCDTGPGNPCPGDSVAITLTAAGAQVITPLVRPFFTRQGECPDNTTPSHCYVPLSSTVIMRFEGDTL
jgi:hypothetical protein